MSAKQRKEKWAHKIKETPKAVYLKFRVGDKAWFITDNKIRCEKITEVFLSEDSPTTYYVDGAHWEEPHVFQTKQALINSLYVEFEQHKLEGEE